MFHQFNPVAGWADEEMIWLSKRIDQLQLQLQTFACVQCNALSPFISLLCLLRRGTQDHMAESIKISLCQSDTQGRNRWLSRKKSSSSVSLRMQSPIICKTTVSERLWTSLNNWIHYRYRCITFQIEVQWSLLIKKYIFELNNTLLIS